MAPIHYSNNCMKEHVRTGVVSAAANEWAIVYTSIIVFRVIINKGKIAATDLG